jgi:t-SNARE complex subunit (syntaxin)
MIDVIDDNIQGTRNQALEGEAQLRIAKAYQATKRRRMCCLLLLLIVAIFLGLLFLWVALGGN